MNTCQYQPSYGELAVLGEMFEKEVSEIDWDAVYG